MSKAENKKDACVYCGRTPDVLTVDHIPPKAIFPKPRPTNLITVPSCRECNEGASKDDEYFRLMVSMRHDTGDHPAVKQILSTIYRSLQKPAKKGFQQALFDSMSDMDIFSNGGIYLGAVQGYAVNLARLDRVAARITEGLFYHHFEKRLPAEFQVSAYSVDGLTNVCSDSKIRIVRMFEEVTRKNPHVFGDGVFAYWYQRIKAHDTMSVWVLTFYERVSFLCLVTPKKVET